MSRIKHTSIDWEECGDRHATKELLLDALALEDAGAFAIVLEAIPDAVAEAVTSRLRIPSIGIGAGPHCDGQVLVRYDLLGLFDAFVPSFVKQYAQVGELILNAATSFASDVREGLYPRPAMAPRDPARVLGVHDFAAPRHGVECIRIHRRAPADRRSREKCKELGEQLQGEKPRFAADTV